MKKLLVVFLIGILMFTFSISAFAHPNVPEQSLQNISSNAANGMHTAWGNIQNANGLASHVFQFRFSPHGR